MMIQNSQTNTYKTVYEKDNALLEVGLVSETIKLRVTLSSDVSKQKIYIGEIKSLEGHPELKGCFGELHENKDCQDWLLDPNNIYLNKSDMSIRYIYVSKQKESVEMAKVCLELYVPNIENKSELLSVIERCNSQHHLKDGDLKQLFKTLAEQCLIRKSESQNEISELKNELKLMNDKNVNKQKDVTQLCKMIKQNGEKVKQENQKLNKKCQNEISELKKQFVELNKKNGQKRQSQIEQNEEMTNKNKEIHQGEVNTFKKELDAISFLLKENEKTYKIENEKRQKENANLFLENQKQINELKKELKQLNEKNIKQNQLLNNALKKGIDAINKQNKQQMNVLEQLKKTMQTQNGKIKEICQNMQKKQQSDIHQLNTKVLAFETVKKEVKQISNRTCIIQSSFNTKMKEFSNELSLLNEQFNSKMQIMKTQSENQSQSQQNDIHQLSTKIKVSETVEEEVKQISKKICTIQSLFYTEKDELSNQLSKLNEQFNRKMETMRTKSKNQSQKIQIIQQKMVSLNIYVQTEKQKQQKIKQQKLMLIFMQKCKQQKWFNQFTFDGKALKKANNNNYYNFVFFESILFDKELQFNIKIVKSKYRKIWIGVIDYDKERLKQHSFYSQNTVCYTASSGYKNPDNVYEGRGVNVGETVNVIVNRNNKKIKWMVNGEQRAASTHQILGDKQRQLFPFVIMFDQQDTIEYVKL